MCKFERLNPRSLDQHHFFLKNYNALLELSKNFHRHLLLPDYMHVEKNQVIWKLITLYNLVLFELINIWVVQNCEN